MSSQAEIREIENRIITGHSYDPFSGGEFDVPPSTPALSWWENFILSATPESHAEGLVNEIYGPANRGLKPDPLYDVADLSSPNIYVKAKGEAKEAVSALTGALQKSGVTLLLVLLAGVIVYAAVPALLRR